MKPFEYFLSNHEVKKCSKNPVLAKSLIKDMKIRLSENWNEDEKKKPKTIFESMYDSIQDFCNSLLALEGLKSYSHEASIVYLMNKGFDIALIQKMDNFRYMRNGSKYYGRIISSEDAKNIKEFYSQIKYKIDKLIKEN